MKFLGLLIAVGTVRTIKHFFEGVNPDEVPDWIENIVAIRRVLAYALDRVLLSYLNLDLI